MTYLLITYEKGFVKYVELFSCKGYDVESFYKEGYRVTLKENSEEEYLCKRRLLKDSGVSLDWHPI